MGTFDRIRVVPVVVVLLVVLEVGVAWNHHPPVTRRNPWTPHAKIDGHPIRRTNPRQNHIRQGYIGIILNPSHAIRRVTSDDRSSELNPEESKSDDNSKVDNEPMSNEQGSGRIKAYLMQGKKDDGLTFKQRLAKMGVATVLSYGMISNLSYAILVAFAWYTFSAKVRGVQLQKPCGFDV
jgi:hypothetical protein